jgi:hypothetical protein
LLAAGKGADTKVHELGSFLHMVPVLMRGTTPQRRRRRGGGGSCDYYPPEIGGRCVLRQARALHPSIGWQALSMLAQVCCFRFGQYPAYLEPKRFPLKSDGIVRELCSRWSGQPGMTVSHGTTDKKGKCGKMAMDHEISLLLLIF